MSSTMKLGYGEAFQTEESPCWDNQRRNAVSFGEQEMLPALLTGVRVYRNRMCISQWELVVGRKMLLSKTDTLSAGKMGQWEEFLPNESEDVSVDQPGIAAHFCNLGSPRVRWHPPCSWGSNLMYTADQRL